jgi:hypothetical protein
MSDHAFKNDPRFQKSSPLCAIWPEDTQKKAFKIYFILFYLILTLTSKAEMFIKNNM